TLLWEFSAPSPIQPDALPDDWSGPSTEFINAMRPPALSASAIEAYQRCPRQYAYSAIYHFNSGEDSYQLFWQATHKTVEQLHKQLHEPSSQPAPIPGQQEVKELYNQHWQALGGPEAPFATLYEEHGHEVVEAMRRKLSTQQDVTWQAREPFDIDIAGQKVRVTVDRVEAATNTNAPVTFVRTRFGKRRGKPAAETRELFYTLASRQQYPGQNVELRSHNMSTGEIEPITLTTRKEQGLYESVEQAIRGLERNDYPAQPAEPFRCPTCPFFLICPA
ncbi:MAG TPA: PD-(D/E)XK nuclease family protein, partial [Ktedonobacteraceae bacterium]|nr:PD-(D/E)XK nuclease family protein [Ktedonobacteraceae bacterium]